MIVVKHKLFWMWDFDKEEDWLNEMSSNGLQLCDVGFCRYTFKEGQPGEYNYRLQMLDGVAVAEKNGPYIQFLEDAGIELVGTLFRWAYFRKKADGKEFDLFSDIDSRLRHLRGIKAIAAILSLVNLFNGINNFHLWFTDSVGANLSIGIICLSIGILIGIGFLFMARKESKMRREKRLHE